MIFCELKFLTKSINDLLIFFWIFDIFRRYCSWMKSSGFILIPEEFSRPVPSKLGLRLRSMVLTKIIGMLTYHFWLFDWIGIHWGYKWWQQEISEYHQIFHQVSSHEVARDNISLCLNSDNLKLFFCFEIIFKGLPVK